MDDVIAYDEYEKDFQSVVLPEYKWMAEQFLLEAIEGCEPEERLEVHMPDEFSRDKSGYTFWFDTQTGGSGANGGVLLMYMGFY